MWFFACFALFLFQSTIVQIHSIQRNITGDFFDLLSIFGWSPQSFLVVERFFSFFLLRIGLSICPYSPCSNSPVFFSFFIYIAWVFSYFFSPCTTFSIHFVLTNLLSFVRNRWIVYRTNSWGYLKNGTFDGMIGALVRKEIDVGGSPAFFRIERAKVIDYTTRTWISR